jgi:MFS family permease
MFLMVFFSWLAGRYYRRRFGWLNPTWITLPTSLFYWSLVLGFLIWSLYALIFLRFFGNLPYLFMTVWISPLFNEENPPIRRIYFALAGAVVISSTLFIQLTHRNNALILVIQCFVLLALGIADHLLLMSLCTPPREDAHA